jgi:coenzyme F420-0:L-glutamate ligase/coenzyme F420-1:gamma-L-glutamate ligase
MTNVANEVTIIIVFKCFGLFPKIYISRHCHYMMKRIEIIAIPDIPLIKKGDDLVEIFLSSMKKANLVFEDNDVLVIAETIVSKAEGGMIDLRNLTLSLKAKKLSKKTRKPPELCQAILNEAKRVVAVGNGPLIVETHHGLICASAGIDHSNVAGSENMVCLLPKNPDRSASQIRMRTMEKTGKKISVIINDTQGRPLRVGAIGTAIGVSGLRPIWVRAGERDLMGYMLKASPIAIADELASAASILMGQSNEGIPAVIIRGASYKRGRGNARILNRERKKDLFQSLQRHKFR